MTHSNYFLNFSNFDPIFLKNCPGDPLDIIFVFDKVDDAEYESEVKTATGSSCGRHFGEKPILGIFLVLYPVAMGLQCLYWGL